MSVIGRKTNILSLFSSLFQNPRDSREMRESDRVIRVNDVPLLRESTGITGSTKSISIPQNELGSRGGHKIQRETPGGMTGVTPGATPGPEWKQNVYEPVGAISGQLGRFVAFLANK